MKTAKHPFDRIREIFAEGYRQKDECTCGPASLVLVGRALNLPAISEEDCLAPKFAKWLRVEEFRTRGMAIHELALAAELIWGSRVEIILRRAFSENRKTFTTDLSECANGTLSAMILNFAQDHLLDRKLHEQGYPHFSPVCGWDQSGGSVVISDVDPELKEPYSVPADKAFAGMALTNPAFGIPRGWLLIRRRQGDGS